jgi:hypothetical protein
VYACKVDGLERAVADLEFLVSSCAAQACIFTCCHCQSKHTLAISSSSSCCCAFTRSQVLAVIGELT